MYKAPPQSHAPPGPADGLKPHGGDFNHLLETICVELSKATRTPGIKILKVDSYCVAICTLRGLHAFGGSKNIPNALKSAGSLLKLGKCCAEVWFKDCAFENSDL